jgi:hypothetical protein
MRYNPVLHPKLGLQVCESQNGLLFVVNVGGKVFKFDKAKTLEAIKDVHLDNSTCDQSIKAFRELLVLSFGQDRWRAGLFKMPLPRVTQPTANIRLPDALKPFEADLFRDRTLPTFSDFRLKACGAIIELYSQMFRYNFFWKQPAFKESVNRRVRDITRKELTSHLNALIDPAKTRAALAEAINAER